MDEPDYKLWAKCLSTFLDCLTQTFGPTTCLLIIITIKRHKKLWILVNDVVCAETIVSLLLNVSWPISHIITVWDNLPDTLHMVIGIGAQAILCLKMGFYFSIATARYSVLCGGLSMESNSKSAAVFISLAIIYGKWLSISYDT